MVIREGMSQKDFDKKMGWVADSLKRADSHYKMYISLAAYHLLDTVEDDDAGIKFGERSDVPVDGVVIYGLRSGDGDSEVDYSYMGVRAGGWTEIRDCPLKVLVALSETIAEYVDGVVPVCGL